MSNCWKSHAAAQFYDVLVTLIPMNRSHLGKLLEWLFRFDRSQLIKV